MLAPIGEKNEGTDKDRDTAKHGSKRRRKRNSKPSERLKTYRWLKHGREVGYAGKKWIISSILKSGRVIITRPGGEKCRSVKFSQLTINGRRNLFFRRERIFKVLAGLIDNNSVS